MEYSQHCINCGQIAVCKKMFGRFWNHKSSFGVGCQAPITKENADKWAINSKPTEAK